LAMVSPEAAGQRFICAEANHSMMEIAQIMKARYSTREGSLQHARIQDSDATSAFDRHSGDGGVR